MISSPDDPKIRAFAFGRWIFQLPVLRHIKIALGLIFVQLAPGVPIALSRSTLGISGAAVGVAAGVATFFFCFVVIALWTQQVGTLSGDEANRVYFLSDTTNLILYTFVCPLYVGLGIWLWMVVLNHSGELRTYASELNPQLPQPRPQWFRGFALLMLILAIALFGTANYISDVTDVTRVPDHYWFVHLLADGTRSIGPLGVYYFLINFVLLTITLISITLFMTIFTTVFRVGAALDSYEPAESVDFREIRLKLSSYTEAYLLGKALAFLYMLNLILWQASPLGKTDNLWIAGLFASLIGVVFISLPRYFVELQWYRYRERAGLLPEDDQHQYQDIRPFYAKALATVFDTLLISGFIMSFWQQYIVSLTNQ